MTKTNSSIIAKQAYYWARHTICLDRGDIEKAKKWLEAFENLNEKEDNLFTPLVHNSLH
jgi:hypothetical protein